MVSVQVRCPSCQKSSHITVEENIVKQSLRGITAVHIAEFFICEHSFIAYVDKNFVVRDCFITDFKIELPEITVDRKSGDHELEEKFKNVDLYIITLNLNLLSMSYILYCLFHRKKILFLNELDVLNHHLTGFIDYIFNSTFDIDLTTMNRDLYRNNKKKYKEHIIFNNEKIISDKNKLLTPKNVKVEQMIIRRFLEEIDLKSAIIILKNEIYKAFHISESIIKYGKKSGKDISRKLIADTLIEKFNVKISKDYLKFLSSIILDYFGVEVVGIKDVDSFIGFI